MWDAVTVDATTKSTLFLLDAEDQLASMKLVENDDPKAHLTEVQQHFQLIGERHDNLLNMGSTISTHATTLSSCPRSRSHIDQPCLAHCHQGQ